MTEKNLMNEKNDFRLKETRKVQGTQQAHQKKRTGTARVNVRSTFVKLF